MAALGGMLRFLSRLPIPALPGETDPHALPDFRRAAGWLPLAGAILALPAAATLALFTAVGMAPLVAAALAVGVSLVITGALHEDGLADVADGFGGGATTERRLAIMKDSRIGAFGGAALVLSLLIRVAALASIASGAGPLIAGLMVIAAGAMSRAAALIPMALLPPARPDGLSAMAGRPTATTLALALSVGGAIAFAAAIAAALSAGAGGGAPHLVLAGGALAIGLAMGLAMAMTSLARRAIGGQTGDVIGAAQQLAEIGFLAALTIYGGR
jgi:adenosylcobinamide-GDP ribazoletransferase